LSQKKTAAKRVAGNKKKTVKSTANQKKSADLWIAPKPTSANGATRKWSEQPAEPAGSRLLELADIALGFKKPDNFRKRRSGVLKQKP
jgi:hypothetical protein